MRALLIAVDGTPASLEAVGAAVREGPDAIARIELLNVQPRLNRHIAAFVPRSMREGWREERARRALHGALARVRRSGIPCRTHMATGRVAPEIALAARSLAVDEIVIAARRRGPLARLLASSVSASLLPLSEIPVRVVPGGPPPAFERFALPAGLGLAALLLLAGD
jgi:nucleotide-binding universal stress UspA family protein